MKSLSQLLIYATISLFLFACSSSQKEDIPVLVNPGTGSSPMDIKQADPAVWGYDGLTAPESWGKLSPEYTTCNSGKYQSPINLVWSRPIAKPDINLNYQESAAQVTDTGRTIMVNIAPGNFATIRGETFELRSITFHSSSEHTLSGNSLPLEVHLVHTNSTGQVAILAYFAIEGPRNATIDKIWSHIPSQKNIEQIVNSKVLVSEMMPKKFNHYNYIGSLTTPPCTEDVQWNILNTPITMSRDQILTFRQIYPHNNRPVQPLNGRKVYNY